MKKRKILVVDDEKGIRDLLHGMLKGMGYEAFSVEDAESALALLSKNHYDLVITDLRLPGQSGEEFLKK